MSSSPPIQEMVSPQIEDNPQDHTPLQKFYNGKTIFLTGGTGFFGKIIIEKLLRVTDVEHIYMLIRAKKGKDVYTRIEEIFDDPVFDLVKREKSKFRHKISLINGDCSQLRLGINTENQNVLKENVDIVIHGAATVRFDEKLKIALAINVAGTRELLSLCRDMVKLKAIVHVSSAFANCNHKHIDEKFYRLKMSGENACKLGECLDEKTLDYITPEIIKDFPNTYTFTKALAEDVVKNLGKGLPIAIFRPAIVITTYKEPVEGWIDNMYGPSGIIVGVAAGILRVFYGQIEHNSQVVPVDMAVNALLASAWDVSRYTYDEPPIYNFTPDPDNLVTWKEYVNCGYRYGVNIPISRSIWHPTLSVTPYKFVFNILSFLYHTVPACFMDAGLMIMGKKPRMLEIYKKVHKFCDVMAYFSRNSWTFTNNNTRILWSKLSDKDHELFLFDMREINWQKLFEGSLYGLRTYVVKEDPNTIPQAKRRYERMKLIHYTLIYTIYLIILFIIYLVLSKMFLG